MKTLESMLNGKPLEIFLRDHFLRLPFSSTGGAQGLTHLLNWATIEEVFKARKSVLRIVQDGKVIKDYAELDFKDAQKHHASGQTLLLRYAERSHQKLKDLAQDFANSFCTEVDIQLYCTPEGHNAFGWHYDVEEVFIIQTQGSKKYKIRPNTVHPNPLIESIPKDLEYEKENSDLCLDVTLESGDWLYIPSGWWHVATTLSESMHISVGLMPSSALDLVKHLPKFLAQNPFWRTRLPIHRSFSTEEEELAFYQDAVAKIGEELARQMRSPEFIKKYLKDKKKF
jgi:50S ribosomal protein L16 3-hydroxylase